MSTAPIDVQPWGAVSRAAVRMFTLTNALGWRMSVSEWGASIVSLWVPDRHGALADVVLGYDDLDGYRGDRAYLGCVVGRCANRIAGARFTLEGREYRLPANDGPHHLHGGPHGSHRRVWCGEPTRRAEGPALDLTVTSPAGDMGYPGTLTARVVYVLGDDGTLRIAFSAEADAPTLCNLAQHTYWNLGGHDGGDVLDHELRSPATHWLPVDDALIPNGEPEAVDGTPFDFRTGRRLGERLARLPHTHGYDHCLVLPPAPAGPAPGQGPGDAGLPCVAELVDARSGRCLTLHSDQRGLQLYTANGLVARGKGGASYGPHHGVCLETQAWPDAVHHPTWPSPVLRPGATYRHTMLVRFRTD